MRRPGTAARTLRRLLATVPLFFLCMPLTATGAGEGLKIGVLAPLSGPFAAGGSSFVYAATLAAEQANSDGGALGRRIAVVVADTEGRVDIARSEALRLVSRERVDALVGAYLSEETMAVVETAAAHRTILMVPVAATAEITDTVRQQYGRFRYVFRVGYSIPQWADMLASFLADRKARTYAFVGTGIRWNRELGDALETAAARRGIAVAYAGYYSPGNPAFDPVAVAVARTASDIVVLGDPGRGAVSFLERFRALSPKMPALSVGGALGDARLAASLPLSGPLFVQAAAWKGSSPAATAYVERFERRFGAPPVGYSDTLPYDAVTVLVAAWRRAGSTESGPVIDALEKGAFPGVAGTYRFDASHQALWGGGNDPLHGTVIRWLGDGSRIVFPAP
jgi:branched-chain amino acid transport system substrate-binding protein